MTKCPSTRDDLCKLLRNEVRTVGLLGRYNIYEMTFNNTDPNYAAFKKEVAKAIFDPTGNNNNSLYSKFNAIIDDIARNSPKPEPTNNPSKNGFPDNYFEKKKESFMKHVNSVYMFYGDYTILKEKIDKLVDKCAKEKDVFSAFDAFSVYRSQLDKLCDNINRLFEDHFREKLTDAVAKLFSNMAFYEIVKPQINCALEESLGLLKKDNYRDYQKKLNSLLAKILEIFKQIEDINKKNNYILSKIKGLDPAKNKTITDELSTILEDNNLSLEQKKSKIEDIDKKISAWLRQKDVCEGKYIPYNNAYASLMNRLWNLSNDYISFGKLDINNFNLLLSSIHKIVKSVVNGDMDPDDAINAFDGIRCENILKDIEFIKGIVTCQNSKIYIPINEPHLLNGGIICYFDSGKMIYINASGEIVKEKINGSHDEKLLESDYLLLEDFMKKSELTCKLFIKNKSIRLVNKDFDSIELYLANNGVTLVQDTDTNAFYFSRKEKVAFYTDYVCVSDTGVMRAEEIAEHFKKHYKDPNVLINKIKKYIKSVLENPERKRKKGYRI